MILLTKLRTKKSNTFEQGQIVNVVIIYVLIINMIYKKNSSTVVYYFIPLILQHRMVLFIANLK